MRNTELIARGFSLFLENLCLVQSGGQGVLELPHPPRMGDPGAGWGILEGSRQLQVDFNLASPAQSPSPSRSPGQNSLANSPGGAAAARTFHGPAAPVPQPGGPEEPWLPPHAQHGRNEGAFSTAGRLGRCSEPTP